MIYKLDGKSPVISSEAYVADNATVIGDVRIGKGSSIWPGAVLRGDMCKIIIGQGSNIQDNATVHGSPEHPAVIGNGCTVGHNAVVHGCTVEDNVLIGMGAVVLDGAVIGKNTIIGAGALVSSGKVIEEGSLVVGLPGKTVRKLTAQEIQSIANNAEEYLNITDKYKNSLTFQQADID